MPAMIIRSYQGWVEMMLIDFPLFMASTMSISSFYLTSQRELFPRTWYKTFLYLPFLMSLGIGLTITNTKAVLEALFGIKSAFARTPKYRVLKKGEKRRPRSTASASASYPGSKSSSAATSPHRLVRRQHGELLHRPVPSALRHRLLVHRPAQPLSGAIRRHELAAIAGVTAGFLLHLR